MDYKEKYIVALERAKEYHDDGGAPLILEVIFPELKESEDELIRKAIKSGIKHLETQLGYDAVDGVDILDIYSWLEKQDEQTHAALNRLKVTSGQKLDPKFKVGDWISGYYTNYKVTAINSIGYVVEDTDGNKINILFKNEKFHHLWTIQDAKDGDLIYVSTEVKGIQAIFHKFENGIIYFHCNLCGDFTQGGYEPSGDVEFVNPLPKTHYQRFFQKMKEACYEWDAKNKTLWQTK